MNRFKRTTLFLLVTASMSFACTVAERSPVDARANAEIDPVFRQAQSDIERMPDSPRGYVNLAALYMKESRRTGDFFLNRKAEAAVNRALEIAPNDIPARKLEASLYLANHRFAEAVTSAQELLEEVPADSFVYGVLADAFVETGDYEQAIAAAQKMVDLKPGTAAYARVAQIRGLHGDHRGAVEMFTEAARSADPSDKETQTWCLVQLGDEHWRTGSYAEAEKVYDEALATYPGYYLALVSKGRLRASLGDYASAEILLKEAQATVPNANATLLLGDIHTVRGEMTAARDQYERFDHMQDQLGDAADHKRLVLSWLDRGRIEDALAMARSEYAAEKSIHSADLLAWALYRSGRPEEAAPYIHEAMRLGTNDARTIYHAGMIAKARGERSEARRLLRQAIAINPAFDLVQAEYLRQALIVLD